MDRDLQTFIRVGLSSTGVVDLAGIRKGLPRRGPERLAELRENLRGLIDGRELSLREFSMMSDLDFETEEDLYSYLRSAYEYLFEDAEVPPEPPL